MFVSLIILLLITFSGLALTYLYDDDEDASMLVRFGAGNVVGAALFSLVGFLVCCFFGMTTATVLLSLALTLLPLALFGRKDFRARFSADFNAARKTLDNASGRKFLSFAYYAALLLILYFFFDRAMIETKDGIYTGGSQNLGDLPFHLGAIFSFTEGNNFPPENPSFAGAKFTYPFMADLITACLVKLGAGVREAMLAQNVVLGFSLIVLLERFARKLTGSRKAGKLAPVILLFCGGLGFLAFLRDYWHDGRGFFEFLWNLEKDYTIRPEGLRWGNALVVLFITQRSLLLGLPITLIVLTKLWEFFNRDAETGRRADTETEIAASPRHRVLASVFIGLLAGTLPLIHVHSLAVLFLVCAVLFFFSLEKWKEWLAFGAAVSVVAIPELIWVMTGSATRLSEFVGWHFGWSSGKENYFVFWAKNLGLFIPLLIAALLLLARRSTPPDDDEKTKAGISDEEVRQANNLLIFYIPFALCFVITNLVKLAPWEWDNIKVLIYWFVASAPLVAWLLAWFWEKGIAFKVISIACLMTLIFSGALDVWRAISGQINYQVFSRDSVAIAQQIKQKTPPNALFLNAPTYNSAVVLAGRRSLMRYSGHLSSYGIEYEPRESEVKRIYEGGALADAFLKKNNIEYVLISPEETGNLPRVNEAFFEKYPKIAEIGLYKVYKVK
ncbi:MAG: hypothetical protein M3384_18735 [Acidobacteriota bacterium]|nr:hypothetical protein [Acidobacteriota bacterium]